jgi:DNA-binding transcriptional ArsR family regulator
MGKYELTGDVLELVAQRFRALAVPARLQVLAALRKGEMTVSELVSETGLGQANLSKHLQILHNLGFVARRKTGLFVHYTLSDRGVFRLCDIVCDRIEGEAKSRRRLLAS